MKYTTLEIKQLELLIEDCFDYDDNSRLSAANIFKVYNAWRGHIRNDLHGPKSLHPIIVEDRIHSQRTLTNRIIAMGFHRDGSRLINGLAIKPGYMPKTFQQLNKTLGLLCDAHYLGESVKLSRDTTCVVMRKEVEAQNPENLEAYRSWLEDFTTGRYEHGFYNVCPLNDSYGAIASVSHLDNSCTMGFHANLVDDVLHIWTMMDTSRPAEMQHVQQYAEIIKGQILVKLDGAQHVTLKTVLIERWGKEYTDDELAALALKGTG